MTNNLQDLSTKLFRVFDRVAAHANILSVDNTAMDAGNALAAAQAAESLIKIGGLTDESLKDLKTKLYRVFDRVAANADILTTDNSAMDAKTAAASAQVAARICDIEQELGKRNQAAAPRSGLISAHSR